MNEYQEYFFVVKAAVA